MLFCKKGTKLFMWVCMVINMLHCMTWRSTEYTYHNDAVVTLTTVCFSAPSCLNNNGIVSVLLFHIIWQWLPVACSLFFLTLVIVVLFFHLRLRVCALLVLFFLECARKYWVRARFFAQWFFTRFRYYRTIWTTFSVWRMNAQSIHFMASIRWS